MELLMDSRSIAEEIQLSVAPVFLLTAIAGLLSILFNRLTYTIDQALLISDLSEGDDKPSPRDKAKMAAFKVRIRLTRWAIGCKVSAAILVCAVVLCIFIGDYLTPDLSNLIAALFIGAMTLIVAGFMLLISEAIWS